MKLNKKTGNVAKSGDLGEQTFSVAATAHAFEILSSRLYTDTKLAIVRELSTNAADAHVDAGCPDKPFDVHLPSYSQSYFEIRDYGTGLSHDDAMTVYTTFFDSTRNDSDDFTGALGLGSKSPFAYTDAFLVTSYFNGTVRAYSAFRNEAGLPSFALMSEATTNEPNGLKIRIDIQTEDRYDFQDAANKVYPWFNTVPNFVGGETLSIQDRNTILSGKGWDICKGSYSNAIRVVMGNVSYTCSADKFTHTLGSYGALTLFVPIGECGIAANREELHYDNKTLQNIQLRIDDAMKDAQDLMEAELESSPTLLQRIRDGRRFKEIMNIRGLGDSIEGNQKDAYSISNLRVTGSKLFIRRDTYSARVYPQHDTVYTFIENDVADIKQKHRNALRYWIDNQPKSNFYLADITSPTVFADTFGAITIKLSEIPAPPRKQSTGTAGGPRCSIKRLTSSYRKMDAWLNTETDDVDPAMSIAVRRKSYNVIFNDVEMEPSIALEIAKSLGFKTVYGLPSSRYDKPRNELGLKDLETEAKKAMLKLKLKGTVAQHASLQYNAGNYSYEFDKEYLDTLEGHGEVCDNVVEFLRSKVPAAWTRLLSMWEIEIPKVDDPIVAFWEKYPLLRGVESNGSIPSNEIQEYIKWKNLNS